MFPILLVEDKDSLRAMLRAALEDQGHAVVEARDQTEALARLHDSRPDLVLSDLRLTAGDGFGVLRAAKDLDPDLPVIVMTAYGSIQDAVLAMKEGALDFLAKPVDLDHLQLLVARALSQRRLAAENQLLKEELAARRGAPNIVGDDPALKRVSAALARAASTDTTVLLLGESGTGKELYARTLHALSPRANGPVCRHQLRRDSRDAARNRALRPREGRVHRRHRPQAGTLRAGASRHAVPRRDWRSCRCRCRPSSCARSRRNASNASAARSRCRSTCASWRRPTGNLKAAVAARQFREDLFFRLSVFPIEIPPLRERGADVETLAHHFIDRFSRDVKKRPLLLSPAALDELRSYRWPGNVRELQNCIERAVILTDGDTIHPRHLNLTFRDGPPPRRPSIRGRGSICRAAWPTRRAACWRRSSGGK